MADITKNITITIADSIASGVVDAYAREFKYQVEVDDEDGGYIPNPETKNQFALRMFSEQAQANMRSMYKSYMRYLGAEAAAAQADVDSFNISVS